MPRRRSLGAPPPEPGSADQAMKTAEARPLAVADTIGLGGGESTAGGEYPRARDRAVIAVDPMAEAGE